MKLHSTQLQPTSQQPKARNCHKAFTLIDLLIMIAIIAILAAILFPVFARARENARRSSCQSNLKQIGLGVMQYTQNYDEKYPPITFAPAYIPNWVQMSYPYTKSTQVYKCPSNPITGAMAYNEPAPVPTGPNVVSFASYKPDNTGKKLVTDLFNKAIEDVAKDPAKDTLVIPAGTYRIASGQLKSGVKLYISKDAVLLGSKDKADYVMNAPEGTTTGRAMLVLKDCKDVRIGGPGTLDGNFGTKYGGKKDGASKNNLLLNKAENVTISGITSIDHTNWNTIVYRSRKVLIDGVTITTHPESPNAEDGIDILSSNDIEVKNCKITVNDDCITVKNKEMDRGSVDMSNIYIHDNEFTSNLVAALKVGTESTPGTWTNIRFENNNCLEGNIKVIVSDGVVIKDLVFKGNTFHKNTDGAPHDTWGKRPDFLIMVDDRHFGVLGKGPGSGSIENVLIEDCVFLNPVGNNVIAGLNEKDSIGTVTFKNVKMGDTLVVDNETARLTKVEFVDKIRYPDAK